jgi:hypothetical protein
LAAFSSESSPYIAEIENKRKRRKKREKRAFGRTEKMRVFLIITSVRNWRIICGMIFMQF